MRCPSRQSTVLLFIAMTCAGPAMAVASPDDAVREVEQQWAKAVESNDPETIGDFLRDDFTFVNPRGQILDKAAHVDDFREGRTVFTAVKLSDVSIKIYDDFAVVTSHPTVTGFAVTPAGKTTFDEQPARFTDTLTRREGKWKAVARQMSLVTP